MLRPLGILALAALSFLAAQGTGIRLFFHLFYLLLALLALSFLWAWSNLRGLIVQRETFTHRTQVGEQARERITIRNIWPFPKLWVELPGGQDVKSRTYHVTPNVATIREYQPGDSFNRIHWRSTARTNQLMVKEFELDPTADVYIVLDMQERIQQQLVSEQPA